MWWHLGIVVHTCECCNTVPLREYFFNTNISHPGKRWISPSFCKSPEQLVLCTALNQLQGQITVITGPKLACSLHPASSWSDGDCGTLYKVGISAPYWKWAVSGVRWGYALLRNIRHLDHYQLDCWKSNNCQDPSTLKEKQTLTS